MQTISCDSFGEHQVCQIGEDGQVITSAEVVHVKSSDHSCYFWHGDYYSYRNVWFYSGYRGSYGFIGRKVWVDRECRAEFKVCLSGIFKLLFDLKKTHTHKGKVG